MNEKIEAYINIVWLENMKFDYMKMSVWSMCIMSSFISSVSFKNKHYKLHNGNVTEDCISIACTMPYCIAPHMKDVCVVGAVVVCPSIQMATFCMTHSVCTYANLVTSL